MDDYYSEDEEEFDDGDNELVSLASDAVSSIITSTLGLGAETYKKSS